MGNDKLLKALEKYCEFLNSVDETTIFIYTPENWAPADNKYARVTELNRFICEGYEVITWELEDGDEGGVAVITIWFTSDGDPWHGTQLFDTMLGQFLFEGKILKGGYNDIERFA